MMNNQSTNQESAGNCSHSTFNAGCGCNDASGIVITISPTTGGQFNLEVRKTDSIDHLKKIISKKLKVLRERICLLHRDRQLINGSLQENDLCNGSRLTLLPIVETGLTTQRPELSVMNALESLNEGQVNDFLSGKAPLNLTMRLGDHMMLIQLMLSTFSNQNQVSASGGAIKTDTPSVAHSATSTEEKRKELSSDLAKYVLVDKPTCSTYSSPRLERILSSGVEMSSLSDEPIGSDNLVDDVNDAASISRIRSRWSSSSTESANTSKDHLCSSTSASLPSSPSLSCATNSPCLISSVCTPTTTATTSTTDAVPLAKATRNLTQTLQKLSSEVLTSKKVATVHQKYKGTSSSSGSGGNIMQFSKKPNAILENMEHHGRGIYSGTFSGTLNPALQDRFGRPKKDVSTIIHILNDLLCAEPRSSCKSSCTCSSSTIEKMDASAGDGLMSASMMSVNDSPFEGGDHISSINFAPSSSMAGQYDAANFQNKHNENQMTRSKMEQLKSIMEERKEKRKEKRYSPYEKRFSSLNLISSSAIGGANAAAAATGVDPWSAATAAESAATMHASKSNDTTLETEPSSIHSKPVIA